MTATLKKESQLILITGLSGAGKSTVLKALEDSSFLCIDNLPVFMLKPFLTEVATHDKSKIALVMDARDVDFLNAHQDVLSTIESSHLNLSVIFLTADDQVLLRRYSEMRRRHPFATTVREGIMLEKNQFSTLKHKADHIIDTSGMTPHELRAEIYSRCLKQKSQNLQVSVISFGFKHGPPTEADILFDVRFLPNPFFIPTLKGHTGLESSVSSYVLDNAPANEFLEKLTPLLQFLVPQYKKEGKAYLTIGIGCTGGKHRSVAVAEELKHLIEKSCDSVSASHRDLGK